MTVSIMKSNLQKSKPKVKIYRDFKNFSNNKFKEYILSKLVMENIISIANDLKTFSKICMSGLDPFAPRGNNIHFMNQTLKQTI